MRSEDCSMEPPLRHAARIADIAARAADVAPPPTLRAILRVGNEFFLRSIDSMARLFDDDLIKALVYNAMWTANVRHITHSSANDTFGGMDAVPPDSMRQPVSVLALANVLRIPYETARRAVQALILADVCIRVDKRGLIVPARFHLEQRTQEAVRMSFPSLLRFLEDLKTAGFDFSPYRRTLPGTVPLPPGGALPANIRAMLRVCCELVMRGVDTLGKIHGDDFFQALIFSAIWVANVRHITGGPDNPKHGFPPDRLRRPVTVNALALRLRMPYETVRRQASRMVRGGIAVRVGAKGLIIPQAQMARLDRFEGVRNAHKHIACAVADLHRAGFDFSRY